MELYLYTVMTDWLQQDIPMLLNSYLQPHVTVLGTTTTTTIDQSPATSNTHYHHLHFYYKALDPKEYKMWQQESTWTCHYEHDDNNTTIDHHRKEKEEEALPAQLELFWGSKGREMMVICPSQPPPPQQQQQQQERLLQTKSSPLTEVPKGVRPVLTHVTVRIVNDGDQVNTTATTTTFTYDVRPFQRCDELARGEAPPPPSRSMTTATSSSSSSSSSSPSIHGDTLSQTNTTTSDPPLLSIGACTQIAGDENHYFLPQWIEYHKLLGVTHFWIYINEPWNGTSISKYIQQQQQQHLQTPSIMEYVTFVPFDYRWREHKSHVQRRLYNWAFFQEAQNNECLYRGRQSGVDWMIMTDVDEFIHVENPDSVNRTATTSLLLQDYLQQEKYSSASSSKVAGIVLNSIPYGRNRLLNHPSSTILDISHDAVFLFDYIWRLRDPPESRPFNRWKNIVRPHQVGHLNVHYATHVAPGFTLEKALANDIRIDHFKFPWKKTFEPPPPPLFRLPSIQEFDSQLIPDPHLQERFGLSLRQALQDQWGITYREADPMPLLPLQQQQHQK
jgi:hypothetical protein